MFRKFLLTAMVAVTASLVAPATSEAAFAVTVTIDGHTLTAAEFAASGFYNQSGPNSSGVSTISGAYDYVGVSGSFTVTSNVPGSGTGYILDSSNDITSVTGSHHVVIAALAQPFTSPGAPGDVLQLVNTLSSIGGTLGGLIVNNANAGPALASTGQDIYAAVDPDNNTGTNNGVRTANSYSLQNGTWLTPQTPFTRGAAYSLANVADLQVVSGDSFSLQTRAIVSAPAPAGLILAATALPFAGLLRRRLRKSELATAA